jgi:hypothetical protein
VYSVAKSTFAPIQPRGQRDQSLSPFFSKQTQRCCASQIRPNLLLSIRLFEINQNHRWRKDEETITNLRDNKF